MDGQNQKDILENNNIKSPATKSAAINQNSITQASPEGDGLMFYNVMPQDKNVGSIVDPSVKVEPVFEDAKQEQKSSVNLKKYKLYIIALVCLLILAPAAYFLVDYFGKNAYKQDEIILNTGLNKTPAEKTPETPAVTEGFTTPLEWREKYFPGCSDIKICGDEADPERDGLNNTKEHELNTDPNNADSDQDGLADGDEVNVFLSNPLDSHTSKDPKYSDADFIKGGYSITTNNLMLPAQLKDLGQKMQSVGLHQPTLTTLISVLGKVYNFSDPTTASSTPDSTTASSTEESLNDKQDRDMQRSSTIKNVEIALVGYFSDNKAYPKSSDFSGMFEQIRPYLKVATNSSDPINKAPMVYEYIADTKGADFTLTYFSEVANQPIKKHSADAIKDSTAQQSDIDDNQRMNDLDTLRTSLLLYSNKNVAGNQEYVFPAKDKLATSLVPEFISQIPKDPKTQTAYDYQTSATFSTFTLKTLLDNPPVGMSGYLCNQEECRNY